MLMVCRRLSSNSSGRLAVSLLFDCVYQAPQVGTSKKVVFQVLLFAIFTDFWNRILNFGVSNFSNLGLISFRMLR